MRKKIVAGNWKMNLSLAEAGALTVDILHALKDKNSTVQLILCPPFPYIKMVADKIAGHAHLAVGAQNCASEASGAFTGEVSARMIESLIAQYVIIGHSERRALFFETDQVLVKKLHQALSNNLIPIFCCGETLSERESGNHFEVIKNQLSAALFQLTIPEFSRVILAYEPVWAIGTGLTASAAQAQEMHQFIRKIISDKFGESIAQNCSILYGGSCNASNAAELFANADVDGGLIGGASLKAKDFVSIANSF